MKLAPSSHGPEFERSHLGRRVRRVRRGRRPLCHGALRADRLCRRRSAGSPRDHRTHPGRLSRSMAGPPCDGADFHAGPRSPGALPGRRSGQRRGAGGRLDQPAVVRLLGRSRRPRGRDGLSAAQRGDVDSGPCRDAVGRQLLAHAVARGAVVADSRSRCCSPSVCSVRHLVFGLQGCSPSGRSSASAFLQRSASRPAAGWRRSGWPLRPESSPGRRCLMHKSVASSARWPLPPGWSMVSGSRASWRRPQATRSRRLVGR